MNQRRGWIIFILLFFTLPATPAKASMFGEENAALYQILANAVQQLVQLRQILATGQDSLDMVKSINQGINDSLALIRTINPNSDPGLYGNWQKVQDALGALDKIYGIPIPSKDFQIQKDADQSVAEAITLNNALYNYTNQIDDVGEAIENASHRVSPGGAQKLTAQSLGVILHVLNASLRAQATGLKLEAQNIAIQNRKDKEATKHILDASDNLSDLMKNQDTSFTLPRF